MLRDCQALAYTRLDTPAVWSGLSCFYSLPLTSVLVACYFTHISQDKEKLVKAGRGKLGHTRSGLNT